MSLQLLTETFESNSLTILKGIDGQAWFLAKDLAQPLGVNRNAVRMQVADLEPSDKVVIPIDTPGGTQKSTFVSESGALQIIVQSRKPEARRLRKWVCDIAVKYSKGELSQSAPVDYITKTDLVEFGKTLVESFAQIVTSIVDRITKSDKVRLMGGRNPRDLPVWSIENHKRMRRSGYITAAEVLAFKLNRKPTAQEAGGLNARTMAYCRAHSLKVNYFYHAGRAKVYLPQMACELVHRTGWTSRNKVLAESQSDLFGSIGAA